MHLKWDIIWWHTCISHRLLLRCNILRRLHLRNNTHNTYNNLKCTNCSNNNNNNICSTNTSNKLPMELS